MYDGGSLFSYFSLANLEDVKLAMKKIIPLLRLLGLSVPSRPLRLRGRTGWTTAHSLPP